MRVRAEGNGMTVQAIAGTHVVLLGLDVSPAVAKTLLGFSIERTDHTEGERYYLSNNLVFDPAAESDPASFSTERSPVQAFVWGDYSAKPGHVYSYEVSSMAGTPDRLRRRLSASVRISTEDPDDGGHGVFFNRGVAASAAYERRFGTVRPSEVPNREGYRWLSRGLEEGIVGFIGRAVDDRFSLRASMYEFQFDSVLDAFKVASDAGADVRITYDNVKGESTGPKNIKAIKAAGLSGLTKARTKIEISHNKFIVLLRNGRPEEVWTGSTNITEGGLFGHANVGHHIRDRTVAERYLAYWEQLNGDPARKPLKAFNDPPPTMPTGRPAKNSQTAIFSPRSELDSLNWYVRLADSARQGVFMTAAFGLTAEVAPIFSAERDYLRYLLLDSEKGHVEATRRDPDNVVSAGAYGGAGGLRAWISKALQYLNNLDYIHTKLMLVDPLTDDPIVITGSANWSQNSSKVNDENMVVIRGDTRVADIYLTEFMRLFNHYRLRGKAKTPKSKTEPSPHSPDGNPAGLRLEPNPSWAEPYFVQGSPEAKERVLFSQAGASRLSDA